MRTVTAGDLYALWMLTPRHSRVVLICAFVLMVGGCLALWNVLWVNAGLDAMGEELGRTIPPVLDAEAWARAYSSPPPERGSFLREVELMAGRRARGLFVFPLMMLVVAGVLVSVVVGARRGGGRDGLDIKPA